TADSAARPSPATEPTRIDADGGPADADSEATARLVLEAAASLPVGVPRSTLAKLLVGSRSERLADLTQHELPGRLAHLRRDELQPIVDRLIADGYLAFLDDRRPAVVITVRGRAALQGEGPDPGGWGAWQGPSPSRQGPDLPHLRRTGG